MLSATAAFGGRDSALRCPRRVQRRNAEAGSARSCAFVPPAERGRGRLSAPSLPVAIEANAKQRRTREKQASSAFKPQCPQRSFKGPERL
jgi:hypothetical protein